MIVALSVVIDGQGAKSHLSPSFAPRSRRLRADGGFQRAFHRQAPADTGEEIFT